MVIKKWTITWGSMKNIPLNKGRAMHEIYHKRMSVSGRIIGALASSLFSFHEWLISFFLCFCRTGD